MSNADYELDYDAIREGASKDVQNMSDEQIDEIYSVFALFDKDGSGSISVDEFAETWRALGQNPTEEELESLLQEVDEDNSGEVDFTEFVELLARYGNSYESEEDQLKAAFQLFDKENKGYITSGRLREFLEGLGEQLTDEEIEEMIAEADANGDGKVDYEEFVGVMMKGSRDKEEDEEDLQTSDKNSNKINHQQTKT